MRKFLLKIAPYILAIVTILAILGSFADGNVDDISNVTVPQGVLHRAAPLSEPPSWAANGA